jgi:D-3-phosphoglycerate dehydrogenase
MPLQVVVADPYLGDVAFERGHAGDRATLHQASLDTPGDVLRATADADAVIVTTHALTDAHIAAFGPRVRIIGRAGIGLDAIDLDAALRRGVAVFHTPDYCVGEVADQTVLSILALARHLPDQERIARSPGWAGRGALRFRPLNELTIGVIGAGRIGQAVLARLAPFGPTRLVFDPFVVDVPPGVEREADLDRLLRRSDVVTLHCPLTPETRGLLSAERLGRMKDGAFLVNVARAQLVDEPALVEALTAGRLGGAALDVFPVEPIPAGSAVLRPPRVILTPHYAWHSTTAETRTRLQTLDGVLAYLGGSIPTDGRMALLPQDPRGAGRRRANSSAARTD